MANINPLIHWRSKGREVHRVEVQTRDVRSELSPAAIAAMIKIAERLEAAESRVGQLEAVLARLAIEATKEP